MVWCLFYCILAIIVTMKKSFTSLIGKTLFSFVFLCLLVRSTFFISCIYKSFVILLLWKASSSTLSIFLWNFTYSLLIYKPFHIITVLSPLPYLLSVCGTNLGLATLQGLQSLCPLRCFCAYAFLHHQTWSPGGHRGWVAGVEVPQCPSMVLCTGCLVNAFWAN